MSNLFTAHHDRLTQFSDLPDDVISYLTQLVDAATLGSLCSVNKRVGALASAPNLWQKDRKMIHLINDMVDRPWILLRQILTFDLPYIAFYSAYYKVNLKTLLDFGKKTYATGNDAKWYCVRIFSFCLIFYSPVVLLSIFFGLAVPFSELQTYVRIHTDSSAFYVDISAYKFAKDFLQFLFLSSLSFFFNFLSVNTSRFSKIGRFYPELFLTNCTILQIISLFRNLTHYKEKMGINISFFPEFFRDFFWAVGYLIFFFLEISLLYYLNCNFALYARRFRSFCFDSAQLHLIKHGILFGFFGSLTLSSNLTVFYRLTITGILSFIVLVRFSEEYRVPVIAILVLAVILDLVSWEKTDLLVCIFYTIFIFCPLFLMYMSYFTSTSAKFFSTPGLEPLQYLNWRVMEKEITMFVNESKKIIFFGFGYYLFWILIVRFVPPFFTNEIH